MTLTQQPGHISHQAACGDGPAGRVGPWLCSCRRPPAPPAAGRSPQPAAPLVWGSELWRSRCRWRKPRNRTQRLGGNCFWKTHIVKEYKALLPRHRSQGLQAEAPQSPGLVLLLLEPPAAAVHHALQVRNRPHGILRQGSRGARHLLQHWHQIRRNYRPTFIL